METKGQQARATRIDLLGQVEKTLPNRIANQRPVHTHHLASVTMEVLHHMGRRVLPGHKMRPVQMTQTTAHAGTREQNRRPRQPGSWEKPITCIILLLKWLTMKEKRGIFLKDILIIIDIKNLSSAFYTLFREKVENRLL